MVGILLVHVDILGGVSEGALFVPADRSVARGRDVPGLDVSFKVDPLAAKEHDPLIDLVLGPGLALVRGTRPVLLSVADNGG